MSEPACDSELRRSDVSHGSPLACHQSSPDTDGFPDDTVTDTGRHSMSLQTAQALAQASSLAVFATMAIWYVAPWLNRRGRAAALAPLLWVHVFRYVALQTVSAQHAGFPISDGGRDEIISGDVAGAILAALARALVDSAGVAARRGDGLRYRYQRDGRDSRAAVRGRQRRHLVHPDLLRPRDHRDSRPARVAVVHEARGTR